ncbi:MAG: hypothetical protein ACOC9Y_03330 [Chloroflexota bacterium]
MTRFNRTGQRQFSAKHTLPRHSTMTLLFIVALVVVLAAPAATARHDAETVEDVSGYDVIMYADPNVEMWRVGEDQPQVGTEKNTLDLLFFQECEQGTDNCVQVDFADLTWERSDDGDSVKYQVSDESVSNTNSDGFSFTLRPNADPDDDDIDQLGVAFDIEEYEPRFEESRYALVMQRSPNPDFEVRSDDDLDCPGLFCEGIDLEDESRGLQVRIAWSDTGTEDKVYRVLSFLAVQGPEYGAVE